MRRICSISPILVLAATVSADDNGKPEMSPKERLVAIQAEHKAAEAAFSEAAQALSDTPEGNKKKGDLWQVYDTGQASRFLAAVALAKANPTSEIGFDALEWVLTIPRSYVVPFGMSAGKAAMELATENHAVNPKIGKIIAWVGFCLPAQGYDSHQAAKALIQAVADKNPNRTTRGQAVMALAWQAMRRFAVAEYKKADNVDALAGRSRKSVPGGGQRLRGLPSFDAGGAAVAR